MKLKQLFTAALLVCSSGAWADDVYKNVTSTYLTNADFEGEFSVYSNPSKDRAIYQPNGWTVSYTTGDPNDMTALNSSCLQWSNFSGKAQLATGGNNTYWVRMRWGTGATLELSQSVVLPKGSYRLTAAYYKNGSGGDGYILVNSTTKNTNVNEDVWKSLSIDFTSDGVAATKMGCKAQHTNTYEKFLAFDNFVLEWDLTDALTTLISEATDVYNEDTSNTALGTAISDAEAVQDSQDAEELETAYNNLKSVAALALNRKSWKEAKDAAEAAVANDDYENVAGAELTTLNSEIAKSEPATAEAYETAATALMTATAAFTAAKSSYDAYVTAKAAAEGVNEADVLAVVIDGNDEATAADALAASVILPKAYANKAATALAPVVTDFVVNGTFDSNVNGWSRTGGFQNNAIASNQNGAFTVPFYENWNGSAKVNKMYQTISNIPNGTYRLDIAAFVNTLADPNESQYVFANNDKVYLTTGDPTAYEVYTVVTNNQIEIGLEQTTATANWMGIDNVSLRYYGAGDVINDAKNASHKLAWEEAKAAAEEAYDDYAYANVTGSEKSALETEIAKDEPSSAAAYDAAAAALNSATSTFTAAKAAYDAYAEIRAIAVALGLEPGAAPSNAAAALAATHTLNVAVYTATTAANIFDVTEIYNPSWSSMSTSSGQHFSGDTGISYADEWRGDTNPTTRNTTVTLPAGSYILMSAGRGSANTVATMSANGTTVTFASNGDVGIGINKDGAASFDAEDEAGFANKDGQPENTGTGWEWRYIPVTLAEESAVTVTQTLTRLSGNAWGSFCDFKILKVGTLATSEDYTALNSAIEAAEGKTLGFVVGQYAPYNNVAALEALAAAKAIDQEAANDQDIVQAVTTALTGTWTPNDGDVDAIYNGHFAEANGNNPKGWTRSNDAWGQQITGLTAEANGVADGTTTAWYYNTNGAWQYGNEGVYTMPLAENQSYELTFKYRRNGGDWQNWMKASVVNGENEGLEVAQFSPADNGTNFVEAKAYFTTGAAGNYILSIEQNGNAHLTDVSLVKVASAELPLNENENYAPIDRTYYETVSLTRTVKEGYNTVVLPFDLTAEQVADVFGEGAKVYSFTETSESADNVAIEFNETTTISANVPVLVNATAESTVVKNINNVVFKSGEAKVEGANVDFVGVYSSAKVEAGDYFIANSKLYKCTKDDFITIMPFRAYIDAPEEASVKFFFGGVEYTDIATALNAIEAAGARSTVFNLAGQRVGKAQKGVYVVGGKKVIIK